MRASGQRGCLPARRERSHPCVRYTNNMKRHFFSLVRSCARPGVKAHAMRLAHAFFLACCSIRLQRLCALLSEAHKAARTINYKRKTKRFRFLCDHARTMLRACGISFACTLSRFARIRVLSYRCARLTCSAFGFSFDQLQTYFTCVCRTCGRHWRDNRNLGILSCLYSFKCTFLKSSIFLHSTVVTTYKNYLGRRDNFLPS